MLMMEWAVQVSLVWEGALLLLSIPTKMMLPKTLLRRLHHDSRTRSLQQTIAALVMALSQHCCQ
jgi:hypothetical protein